MFIFAFGQNEIDELKQIYGFILIVCAPIGFKYERDKEKKMRHTRAEEEEENNTLNVCVCVPTFNVMREGFGGSASESDMLHSMQVSLERHWLVATATDTAAVATAAAVLLTQCI